MSKDLKRTQQHARELARSGKFVGLAASFWKIQFQLFRRAQQRR